MCLLLSLKETRNSYFRVTPKNQVLHELPHFSSNNSEILTKNIFHWLELITEILSFLQIFSVRKTTTKLLIFQKLYQNVNKKNYICGIFWAFKSKLQIIHTATYIALFLPDSYNCFFFFICLKFSHFVFLFSPSFHTLLTTRHIKHEISLKPTCNITKIKNTS